MPAPLTTDPQQFQATVSPYLQRDPVLNAVLLEDLHSLCDGGLPTEFVGWPLRISGGKAQAEWATLPRGSDTRPW